MKKKIVSMVTIIIILFCQISAYAKSYEYDDLNRVTKVIYDDGSYTVYKYDGNGNITNISVYNKNGESIGPEETTKKQQETTKRQQETTKKQQETTKRQQETTKKQQEITRQQETTKKQQETTRQEETTKKQQESTRQQETTKKQQETTRQEETTRKQQETTSQKEAMKKQQETTKRQETTKITYTENLSELNRQNETIRNRLKNVDAPFYVINEYLGKDEIYYGNTSINEGMNHIIDKKVVINNISKKMESFVRRFTKKCCEWLVMQSTIRQIK